MKGKHQVLARRYQSALRRYLKQDSPGNLQAARVLGKQARASGLGTQGFARIHEQTMVAAILPSCPPGERTVLLQKAAVFFVTAVEPAEGAPSAGRKSSPWPRRVLESLSRRGVELAAGKSYLEQRIIQQKQVELEFRNKERRYSERLEQSGQLQTQLRRLSRQILSAQEDERRVISRELHDVIAQTLTGINTRLATLKKAAGQNARGLEQTIAVTQRLVEDSVEIVHRFARNLRPAVLDDLGLIPALQTFMKSFVARTGVRTRLTAFAGVEQLDTVRRTVLFRVAQEALNNVARHAKATEAEVIITKIPEGICMKIHDDGRSFNVKRVLHSNSGRRLGVLGMRERLEMIGGRLDIDSAPDRGSTIVATIPLVGPQKGAAARPSKVRHPQF